MSDRTSPVIRGSSEATGSTDGRDRVHIHPASQASEALAGVGFAGGDGQPDQERAYSGCGGELGADHRAARDEADLVVKGWPSKISPAHVARARRSGWRR